MFRTCAAIASAIAAAGLCLPLPALAESCTYVGTSAPFTLVTTGSYTAGDSLTLTIVSPGVLAANSLHPMSHFTSFTIDDGVTSYTYTKAAPNAHTALATYVGTDNSGTPYLYNLGFYVFSGAYNGESLLFSNSDAATIDNVESETSNQGGVTSLGLLMSWTNSCNPEGARRANAARLLQWEQRHGRAYH
jgi:hypothetical protein